MLGSCQLRAELRHHPEAAKGYPRNPDAATLKRQRKSLAAPAGAVLPRCGDGVHRNCRMDHHWLLNPVHLIFKHWLLLSPLDLHTAQFDKTLHRLAHPGSSLEPYVSLGLATRGDEGERLLGPIPKLLLMA